MKPASCYSFSRVKFNQLQSIVYYTFVFMYVLAASSAPTPLYHLYQSQIGFSTITLTLIFAVYSFSLLLTLLIVGSLSDYIGRKPIILVAMLCFFYLWYYFYLQILFQNYSLREHFKD